MSNFCFTIHKPNFGSILEKYNVTKIKFNFLHEYIVIKKILLY